MMLVSIRLIEQRNEKANRLTDSARTSLSFLIILRKCWSNEILEPILFEMQGKEITRAREGEEALQ